MESTDNVNPCEICRHSPFTPMGVNGKCITCKHKNWGGTLDNWFPDLTKCSPASVVMREEPLPEVFDAIKEEYAKGYAESVDSMMVGAVKADQNKPRTDLIPPEGVLGLADLYAVGAEKYADRNWEKGMDYTRLLGAMERHMLAYKAGENYAPDDKQHHMLSVAWCAFAIFTFDCRDMADEWDDRPFRNEADAPSYTDHVAQVANLDNKEVANNADS